MVSLTKFILHFLFAIVRVHSFGLFFSLLLHVLDEVWWTGSGEGFSCHPTHTLSLLLSKRWSEAVRWWVRAVSAGAFLKREGHVAKLLSGPPRPRIPGLGVRLQGSCSSECRNRWWSGCFIGKQQSERNKRLTRTPYFLSVLLNDVTVNFEDIFYP